jgi:type IV secretory pathway TrbF-like protein
MRRKGVIIEQLYYSTNVLFHKGFRQNLRKFINILRLVKRTPLMTRRCWGQRFGYKTGGHKPDQTLAKVASIKNTKSAFADFDK